MPQHKPKNKQQTHMKKDKKIREHLGMKQEDMAMLLQVIRLNYIIVNKKFKIFYTFVQL